MKVKILAAIIAVAALAFGAGSVASAAAPVTSTYVPVAPVRFWDSRMPGNSGLTANDTSTMSVPVPVGATAVVLNITATAVTANSYLAVYPADIARPNTSTMNYTRGQTVANLVIVKLSPDGRINFYNQAGNVDIVLDLQGYYMPTA